VAAVGCGCNGAGVFRVLLIARVCPDMRILGTRGSQVSRFLDPPVFDGGPPSALRPRSPFNDDRRERSAGLRGSVQ
jgi:hypothetical protein